MKENLQTHPYTFQEAIVLEKDSAVVKVLNSSNTPLAVKVLQNSKAARLEVSILQHLSADKENNNCKHIIQLLDFFKVDNHYRMAIVLPYYPYTGREFTKLFSYDYLCSFMYQLLKVTVLFSPLSTIYLSIHPFHPSIHPSTPSFPPLLQDNNIVFRFIYIFFF